MVYVVAGVVAGVVVVGLGNGRWSVHVVVVGVGVGVVVGVGEVAHAFFGSLLGRGGGMFFSFFRFIIRFRFSIIFRLYGRA